VCEPLVHAVVDCYLPSDDSAIRHKPFLFIRISADRLAADVGLTVTPAPSPQDPCSIRIKPPNEDL
jgi:hypothetical protein